MLRDSVRKLKIEYPQLDNPEWKVIYSVRGHCFFQYYGSDAAVIADYGDQEVLAIHVTRSLLDNKQLLIEIILTQAVL